MVRNLVFSLMAAGFAALSTSCLQVGLDTVGTKVVHQRKDLSVAGWKDRKVGRTVAAQYLSERIGVLIGGDTRFDFEFQRTAFSMRAGAGSGDFSIGSAAAVTPDGYYLTAAHCLNEKGLRLIAYTPEGVVYAHQVRTVWSGKEEGMDLALIHIPVPGVRLKSFSLADASALEPGVEVLAGGVGGLKHSQSAGKILSVRDRENRSPGPWKSVVHSTTLIKGDSGGPVMNEAGKLVGITSTGGAFGLGVPGARWVHSYRSGAVWADPRWIHSLIEQDRRMPRAKDGPTVLMKPGMHLKSAGP